LTYLRLLDIVRPVMAELNLWRSRAAGNISCSTKERTTNVAQNLLITRAYPKLYIDNPKVFKWAGMAAYASDMVGLGVSAGKALDIFADGNARAAGVLFSSDRLNTTDLDNMLIHRNRVVYNSVRT